MYYLGLNSFFVLGGIFDKMCLKGFSLHNLKFAAESGMTFLHEQMKMKMLKKKNLFSKENEKEFEEFIDALESRKN